VVTHQLQVERRTAKARRPKTDVLPLDHATNQKWYGPDGSENLAVTDTDKEAVLQEYFFCLYG